MGCVVEPCNSVTDGVVKKYVWLVASSISTIVYFSRGTDHIDYSIYRQLHKYTYNMHIFNEGTSDEHDEPTEFMYM